MWNNNPNNNNRGGWNNQNSNRRQGFGFGQSLPQTGYVETSMTKAIPDDISKQIVAQIPLGRMGAPEEVASLVKFLATEGSYCTGSVFHVNGGMFGG